MQYLCVLLLEIAKQLLATSKENAKFIATKNAILRHEYSMIGNYG
jgi:hypothetical protein